MKDIKEVMQAAEQSNKLVKAIVDSLVNDVDSWHVKVVGGTMEYTKLATNRRDYYTITRYFRIGSDEEEVELHELGWASKSQMKQIADAIKINTAHKKRFNIERDKKLATKVFL